MTKRNQRISNTVYSTVTIQGSQQMLSVDNTAAGVQLDASKIEEHTELVILQAQVAPIRFTTDGSVPVGSSGSANGETLEVGERYVMAPADARNAKFIRDGSTDAILSAKAQSI